MLGERGHRKKADTEWERDREEEETDRKPDRQRGGRDRQNSLLIGV